MLPTMPLVRAQILKFAGRQHLSFEIWPPIAVCVASPYAYSAGPDGLSQPGCGDAVMRVGAPLSILLLIGCQSSQPAKTRSIDAPYAYCAVTHDPTSEAFAECWRRQL